MCPCFDGLLVDVLGLFVLADVLVGGMGVGEQVIMMDPPWQLATSAPSRGVTLHSLCPLPSLSFYLSLSGTILLFLFPSTSFLTHQTNPKVALGYAQLHNRDIEALPLPKLQKNGFLFIWVINARYAFALELFKKWGYRSALFCP